MYSKLKLYGDCDVDYVWTAEGGITPEEIDTLTSEGIQNLSWTSNTLALSNFNGDPDGNSAVADINIYKFVIQRREVGTDNIEDVAVTEETSIHDWGCQSTKTYEYIVTPIYKDANGNDCFADRSTTDPVKLDLCGVNIIDLVPTQEGNIYTVNPDSLWKLWLNVENITYTTSNNVSFINTYSRFPKEHRGKLNHLTASISTLLGNVYCDDYEDDNIDKINAFRAFCNNGNLKLLKDTKGNIIPCSIKSNTDTANNSTVTSETTITFEIVQLADAQSLSIYVEGVD